MASHGAASDIAGNRSGLSRAVLQSLQKNGGYVFATFNRSDLLPAGGAGSAGLEALIEHIVHLAAVLGADHVGIGSDYQAAGQYVPPDLNQVDTYRRITAGLRAAGLSAAEIEMILSGSFLKAMQAR